GIENRFARQLKAGFHDAFQRLGNHVAEHQQPRRPAHEHGHGGQFLGTRQLALLPGLFKPSGGGLFGFILTAVVVFGHGLDSSVAVDARSLTQGEPMTPLSKANISSVSCWNCGRNPEKLTQTMNRPNTRVKGKPRLKIFIRGAARVMTPNARFTTSKAVTAGSAIIRAPTNIQLNMENNWAKASGANAW